MTTIFYPVIALVTLTFLVQLGIAVARVGAGLRRRLRADDFKYGESATVPPDVSIPNRNYMNLLEAPLLFYLACIVLYVTAGVTGAATALAWLYVALRVLHSAIHLTYNNVMHRLTAFAASNGALLALWAITALHIASKAGAV